MPTVSTAVRVPSDVLGRYENLARSTGRTRSYYLNEALARSIERLEYEYGIKQDVEDWRAGKLQTYSLREARSHCGLED